MAHNNGEVTERTTTTTHMIKNEKSERSVCLHRRTTTSYCCATCLLELIMLKRDILHVPGIAFSTRDVDDAMRDMCNDWS